MALLKTHCLRGHPLQNPNLTYRKRKMTRSDGVQYYVVHRQCKTCTLLLSKRQHLKVRKGIITELPPAIETPPNKCIHGHALTEDNVYTSSYMYTDRHGKRRPRNERKCKTCKMLYNKKWNANGRQPTAQVKYCSNGHALTKDNISIESAGVSKLKDGTIRPKVVKRCKACRNKVKWARIRRLHDQRQAAELKRKQEVLRALTNKT